MGLPAYIGQMLFAENAYKPITGDVGFIGRQTTYLRPVSLEHLAKLYSFTSHCKEPPEFDGDTRAVQESNRGAFITDRYLMKFLGAKSFKSIDVSDYEGADIIFDICSRLPAKLKGSFDFIYDGSCLDNVFNPAAGLRNISRLLRPGGRALLFNHGTWVNGPYTVMSPGWFFDFFVANGYADCQVFLIFFKGNEGLHFGPVGMSFYNWSSGFEVGNIPGNLPQGYDVMVAVLAQKGPKSTDNIMPVQHQYRDKEYDTTVFRKNARRIVRSRRRLFSTPVDLAADRSAYIALDFLGRGIPL